MCKHVHIANLKVSYENLSFDSYLRQFFQGSAYLPSIGQSYLKSRFVEKIKSCS